MQITFCHQVLAIGPHCNELKGNAIVGLCKIYIASALLYCRGLCVMAFRVKLSTNDLNLC